MALLSFMFLSGAVFGQGTGATLTGIVADSSGGVLPGATVTARNVDTGVETRTTSNNTGSYTFPSLPVGLYEIVAEASGFSRAVTPNVRLNVGAQSRLNFTMAVAGTVTEVQVSGTSESLILEAGASTGTVMQEQTLASIPLLSNNVMDLINIMGGVTPADDPVWTAANQTFAGVPASGINVTRDGMSVVEVRNPTGINAATNINTEMVGEFRMVLSPVDAEMGRGAGQVQLTTRSGSNAFHGSAVWSNQNTVLDAHDYSLKQSGTPKSWRNLNNYMLTASGPLIRNKTFFFATWEHQIARDKQVTNTKVLTPCARKGILRYVSGFDPAAYSGEGTYTPDAGYGISIPSVMGPNNGAPLLNGEFRNSRNNSQILTLQEGDPGTYVAASSANGNTATVSLRIESVFGNMTPDVRTALLNDRANPHGVYGDCEDIVFNPATNTSMYATSTNIDGLYGAYGGNAFLQPNSYWGGDFENSGVYRYALDRTGFVQRFTFGAPYNAGTVVMPPANYYGAGDGLNLATHQWENLLVGAGASIYGTGGDPDRKSITVKLDHNINNDHRLSGTYTYEHYFVYDAYRQWPEKYGGYGGTIDRKPQNIMVSLTSTLRPTLLNEARFGLSLSDTWTNDPYNAQDSDKMRSVLEELLPLEWSNNPFNGVSPLVGAFGFHTDSFTSYFDGRASHPFGSRGNVPTTWGGSDPRWTIADTVTWMKGSHSFKGGVEYRRQSSSQDFYGIRAFVGGGFVDKATVFGGLNPQTSARRTSNPLTGDGAWADRVGWDNFFDMGIYIGMPATTFNLMGYFAGAVSQVNQYYYGLPDTASPTGSSWNDPVAGDNNYVYEIANHELSLFFKDDWKLTNDLTLNLGVRYEFYGVPYTKGGRTLKLSGVSSQTVFGISHGGWDTFMQSREMRTSYTDDEVSSFVYVGPDSKFGMSDTLAWNPDRNNFAPHIGFAWQLPWFGRGQTTLRGGWSVSYSPIDNFNMYGVMIGDIGGLSYEQDYAGSDTQMLSGYDYTGQNRSSMYYMDFSDLRTSPQTGNGLLNQYGLLDRPTSVLPLPVREIGGVNGWATAVDENIKNPYVHSVNMSLTRNIGRNLTVDVRYIGTLSRNSVTSTDVNTANWYQNGLYNELLKVRQGKQSDYINSLIPNRTLLDDPRDGITNVYTGVVYTGSDQVRNATGGGAFAGTGSGALNSTQADLISGNWGGIAGTLATTNGYLVPATGMTPTTAGLVARAGCLPSQQDASGNCTVNTPYNYFYTNPQYASASMYYNAGMSNYHSMQTQVTLRPTRGLNFQATWTWSRALGASSITDYRTGYDFYEDRDYLLTGQHRSHTLNTYGSWDLPFGANGFLLRDATGFLKKAVEGWQLSWVTQMSTGSPVSVTGSSTLWGRGWPNLVRPDLWDNKAGKAEWTWTDQGASGLYYGQKYIPTVNYTKCQNQIPNADGYLATALFQTSCMTPPTTAGGNWTVSGGAPRALALRDPNAPGEIARYSSLEEALRYDANAMMEMAPDGTYTLMPSIVVFRSANNWDDNPVGNFKPNQATGIGRFSFDLAMTKAIEFMEGKRFELRIDAQNILNHSTPTNGSAASYGGRFMSLANPSLSSTTSGTFGYISTRAGHRTFQARLALRF